LLLSPNSLIIRYEINHGIGAGDQYVGGIDVHGHTITTAPPNAANSIMGDLKGPANTQTIDEEVASPTNTHQKMVLPKQKPPSP
jgi:hypothetical protein